MRLPTTARTIAALSSIITAGTLLLSACSADVASVAPAAAPTITSVEATSSFVPTAASRALVGVSDGTYTFTVKPNQDQEITIGANLLSLPSNSVCDLETSSYGPGTWDRPCSPEHKPFVLTVVVKNASSAHPSMQFFPAMRFNPNNEVRLFFYAPKITKAQATNWLVFYCNDSHKCVDESIADKSLTTYIDYQHGIVYRRVKHFSGYVVAENSDGGNGGDGGLMQP